MATRVLLRSALLRRARSPHCARSLATSASAVQPAYVVFGAAGGIGSELTRLLSASGGRVLAVGRDEGRLASASWAGAPGVTPLVADACAPGGADAALAAAVEQFGAVSGVANCIGSVLLKAAHQTSDAELATVLQTNLGSAFGVLRASVKAMGKTGGSIVLCSSAVASHGLPNHEAIAAAKGAVAGLALSAAATYAPSGIRVNCVSPGLTRTPMTARITGSEAALKASVEMHALKRIGEAGDVARAIAFLLHPDNAFITGQNLAVDGGLSSLKPR